MAEPHLNESISETLERSLQLLRELDTSALPAMHTHDGTPIRFQHEAGQGDFVTPRKIRAIQDLSITVNPDEISNFEGEVTFITSEPWKSSTDKLFGEFLEAAQGHGPTRRAFEVIENFIEICSNKLEFLKSMDPYKISSRDAVLSRVWLQNERNTWRLLHMLYQDRLNSQHDRDIDQDLRNSSGSNGDNADPKDMPPPKQISELEIVQQMFRNNNSVRECQLVIDWLERIAIDARTDEYNIVHYTDKTVAWENTLHQLLSGGSSIPFSSKRPMVSKIDPDAPIREDKSLHDLDAEDERHLLRDIFLEIRCGQLEEAQKLCVHCGQYWRAATFEGWRLFHDPNYDTVSVTGDKLPIEGNPTRDIWKLCTYKMTNCKKLPPYERAAYAVYCGNLVPLREVALSWDDLLWSYLKVRLDILVETEIRDCSTRSYVPMPDDYWQNKLDLEDIFSELASSKKDNIQKAAKTPICLIQKYLILDDIPCLMKAMEEWVQQSDELEMSVIGSVLETGRDAAITCNPHFLRFLAHTVLFLRLIGRCNQNDPGDEVLKAYIRVLMSMKELQLVAFYVSTLSQNDQISLYAEFLENVISPEDRKICLTMAEYCGLDIETITKTVVENVRNKTREEPVEELSPEETEEDLKMISALDWVFSYPSQRVEAIWQANALIRHFLALKKFSAARKSFNKIPADSIRIIRAQYGINYADIDDDNQPPKVSSSIKEYFSIKAYLEAHEAFADWFRHFTNAKPVCPSRLQGEVPFSEQIAYEERKNLYNIELRRWKLAMEQLTENVKCRLYNVLMIPPYGWMKDKEDMWDDEEKTEEIRNREHQMQNLRQLCIPEVVLLLIKVIHEMGDDAEYVKLANVIASQHYKLYKVYTKQQLRDLLSKFYECSTALLDNKLDPWGFTV